ncbi:hypothetical protein PHYNN_241 [Pantoea phage Phynn]|nr:hypothetical protein PHYNN_241 [Pantoea phage Phynn]
MENKTPFLKIPDLLLLIHAHGSNQTLGGLLSEQTRKYPHKCPKCSGVGGTQQRYNAYPRGLPDSGWADDWKYKWVECDICKGNGYTEIEMIAKPITVEYVAK